MGLTKAGFYTFEVAKAATKDQISKVVSEKFKVEVEMVRTIKIFGKTKTQRTKKGYFKMADIKKAIVKLKKGDKIALFEQVTSEMSDPHAGHDHSDVQVRTAEGEALTTVKEKKSLLKGTKVKIEKTADKEKLAKMEDHQSPTKTSDKPAKKGAK